MCINETKMNQQKLSIGSAAFPTISPPSFQTLTKLNIKEQGDFSLSFVPFFTSLPKSQQSPVS